MFSDVGPLPNLLLPALFGALGVTAVWWIQGEIRRRRLLKLGFSAEDLKSKEQLLKRIGEIAVSKIPNEISLEEIASHSWSKPARYLESKTAFESLGFRRTRTFVASPKKWVVEFWLSDRPGLYAKIIDSKARGVYAEVTVINPDGSPACFENTEDCGLKHRAADRWVHCGLITPAQLVERALLDTQTNDAAQMTLADCVSSYEQSVNECLAWRRSVGISADEVKQVIERLKKKGVRLKRELQ
jgi:hypothetical protein